MCEKQWAPSFFYLEVSINSNIPAVRQASGSKNRNCFEKDF